MIGILACVVLTQQRLFGKWNSRQAFAAALSNVENGWTKHQVEALLGRPDDIWGEGDSRKYIDTEGREAWCYGTNGHHTFPTLGRIDFVHNTVVRNYQEYGAPPDPEVISERDLRQALGKLHRFSYFGQLNDGIFSSYSDPLRLVQAANDLMPLGMRRALAVMHEYERLGPDPVGDSDFLHWVGRVLFVGKRPGYAFPIPRIGKMFPEAPRDISKWPNYPFLLTTSLPISIYDGKTLMGVAETFRRYSNRSKKDWEIISNKLIPPEDPFLLYEDALQTRVKEFDERDKRHIGEDIIRSVRNVIKVPKEFWIDDGEFDSKGFEDIHQRFLQMRCHWDRKRNCYVRGDGTFDRDPIRD